MIAEEGRGSWPHLGVPIHAEPSRDDGKGEGADEAHLMHGGAPIRPPIAQAVAGGGGLLAFRVLADHVPAVVDGRIFLCLLRFASRMCPGPGWQGALGAGTCGARVTRAVSRTHKQISQV